MKPSPKVPTAKPPIAMPLRHAERRCQRPSASSPRRQRLAAALLSHRAARAQAQVEVVEDLCRLLVGHAAHCSLLRRCAHASCTCPTSISAHGEPHRLPSGARVAGRADPAGARDRRRRPPHRGAGPSTRRLPVLASLDRRSPRGAREPTSRTPSPRASRARGAISSASGGRPSRPTPRPGSTPSGSTRSGRGATSRARSATRSSSA